MERNIHQMSLIELAEELLMKKKKPHTFQSIFKELCEIKGLNEDESLEVIGQFYTDFISCAKFVYCGEDLWDLKSRQSLDSIDKEFYAEHKDILEEFILGSEEDDEYGFPDDKVVLDDEYDLSEDDEDDEDDDDDIIERDDDIDIIDEDETEKFDFVENLDNIDAVKVEDDDFIDSEFEDDVEDEIDEDDDENYDEEEYNKIMDEYEKFYE